MKYRFLPLAVFSVGLVSSALAATPVAVWDGDFSAATKDGWTLSLKDGSALPAAAGNLALSANALKLTIASTNTKYTNGAIVVRYSGYTANSSKNHTALSAAYISKGIECGCEANDGVLNTYYDTTVNRSLDKAIGSYSKDDVAIPSSGYMILAYNAGTGTAAFFADTNKAEWKGGYDSGMRWGGKTVDGFAVGGPWRNAPADTMGPCTAMTIEAIAVFEEYNGLDLSGIEGLMAYKFPSELVPVAVWKGDFTDADVRGSVALSLNGASAVSGGVRIGSKPVKAACDSDLAAWTAIAIVTDAAITSDETGSLIFAVDEGEARPARFGLGIRSSKACAFFNGGFLDDGDLDAILTGVTGTHAWGQSYAYDTGSILCYDGAYWTKDHLMSAGYNRHAFTFGGKLDGTTASYMQTGMVLNGIVLFDSRLDANELAMWCSAPVATLTSGRHVEISADTTVSASVRPLTVEVKSAATLTFESGATLTTCGGFFANAATTIVAPADGVAQIGGPIYGNLTVASGTLRLAAHSAGQEDHKPSLVELGADAVVQIGTDRGYAFLGAGTVDVTLTAAEEHRADAITLFVRAPGATTQVGRVFDADGVDVTSRVTRNANTVTINHEAKDGTTYYITLKKAIESQTGAAMIELLGDVTDAGAITVARAITVEGGTNILENATFTFVGGTITFSSGCIGVAYASGMCPASSSCWFNRSVQEGWAGHGPTDYSIATLSTPVRTGTTYQYEFVKSGFEPSSGEQLVLVADEKGADAGAIKLNSEWVKTKTGTDNPQEQAVALNTKQTNNLMAWQNAVLGLDGTKAEAKPVVAPVQSTLTDKITFKLGGCNVDTASGATVTYKVLSADSPGASTWTAASGETAHDATVSVDLPSSGVRYYKLDVNAATSK